MPLLTVFSVMLLPTAERFSPMELMRLSTRRSAADKTPDVENHAGRERALIPCPKTAAGGARVDTKPGRGLLTMLKQQYGMPLATLQQVGALIVMWGTFECDLEKAVWRLSGEEPYGKVPTTDNMQISQRIARFRHLGDNLEGIEWRETVELLSDVAENLAAYRNAIVHGRLLPASVGGGMVLNATWYGELRKRPGMDAHIDEPLVGMMLDALHELIIVMAQVADGDSAPNTNSRILARRHNLRRAKSNTSEVRYLTALMNSETY